MTRAEKYAHDKYATMPIFMGPDVLLRALEDAYNAGAQSALDLLIQKVRESEEAVTK